MFVSILADAIPKLTPDSSQAFGSEIAQNITNGIGFYGLLFCLVGIVLSAAFWAVGSFSSNYTQQINGKKGFLISAGSALAIGAAAALISWFEGAGASI